MKRKYVFILLFLAANSAWSQEAAITSGGNAAGGDGTSSYSIGQVVYTTIFSETGSSAQGVQHPELEVITLLEPSVLGIDINIAPNPTADQLNITIDRKDPTEGLFYRMYAINGQLIASGDIVASTTTIRMDELPAATYMLQLHNELNQQSTFKVIKLK